MLTYILQLGFADSEMPSSHSPVDPVKLKALMDGCDEIIRTSYEAGIDAILEVGIKKYPPIEDELDRDLWNPFLQFLPPLVSAATKEKEVVRTEEFWAPPEGRVRY